MRMFILFQNSENLPPSSFSFSSCLTIFAVRLAPHGGRAWRMFQFLLIFLKENKTKKETNTLKSVSVFPWPGLEPMPTAGSHSRDKST